MFLKDDENKNHLKDLSCMEFYPMEQIKENGGITKPSPVLFNLSHVSLVFYQTNPVLMPLTLSHPSPCFCEAHGFLLVGLQSVQIHKKRMPK